MALISPYLRNLENNGLMFYCPGCKCPHVIYHGKGSGPRWTWNGEVNEPTFEPSVKVTWPANPAASDQFKEWRKERICHSFVRNGTIEFLSDCTHELANQTVPLPRWSDVNQYEEEE